MIYLLTGLWSLEGIASEFLYLLLRWQWYFEFDAGGVVQGLLFFLLVLIVA